jgi:hypothetical protein
MVIKQGIRFFLSLRTSMWLLGFLLVMFCAGAFIMPGREEFQGIHTIPMLEWLKKQPLGITWWLWCIIGILTLLTINTLFCSIESIVKKGKVNQWLLLISPQIIHAGFLFMLLAHLLSAYGGFQSLAVAGEGSLLKLSKGKAFLKVKEIHIRTDAQGYISNWNVDVHFMSDGKILYRDTIRPNSPSIRMGLNINVKDLRGFPHKAVLLQVNSEPGAFWALVGGILFMIGIIVLIVLKIKVER